MLALVLLAGTQLTAGAAPKAKTTANDFFIRSLHENETVAGRNLAIVHIDQAIAMDGNNAMYWRQKGAILSSMDEHEQALPCFEKSLKIDPNDCLTWNSYSNTLSNLKRYPEALAAVDKGIKMDPGGACRITKSAILAMMRRFPEAEKELDIAIKTNPENLLARSRRPDVSFYLGHWDKVIADTTILIPRTHDGAKLAELYRERGEAYAGKTLYDKAVSDYKTGLKLHPDMRQLHESLRKVYKLKGDTAGVRAETAELAAIDEDLRPGK